MKTNFSREEVFISKYDEPLKVDFNYYPGSPGVMYKCNGDPGDPPESEEVEILYAMMDGIDVCDTLSDEEIEELEIKCMELAAGYEPRGYDDE